MYASNHNVYMLVLGILGSVAQKINKRSSKFQERLKKKSISKMNFTLECNISRRGIHPAILKLD